MISTKLFVSKLIYRVKTKHDLFPYHVQNIRKNIYWFINRFVKNV